MTDLIGLGLYFRDIRLAEADFNKTILTALKTKVNNPVF